MQSGRVLNMNAVKKVQPEFAPTNSPSVAKPRPKRHLRQRSYRIMAVETTIKIGVNFLISAAAISALSQMLPYNWAQQEKIRAITTQRDLVKARVSKIQADFQQNFDPHQARDVMQKHGHRFDPNQRPVFITNNNGTGE